MCLLEHDEHMVIMPLLLNDSGDSAGGEYEKKRCVNNARAGNTSVGVCEF
jgi:hypothetical protein